MLKTKNHEKRYELKRSFAPVISKLNAGRPSMANPRVPLLEAAFTAITTGTSLKPSAFNYQYVCNAGIIPDLPFFENDLLPLIEFVSLFQSMQAQGLGENVNIEKPKKDKNFPRPKIFFGNYPNRPQSFGLGAVSLIACLLYTSPSPRD